MKSILDPSFKYIPAADTDLKKTFARIKREQAAQKAEREAKVTVLQRAKEERKEKA